MSEQNQPDPIPAGSQNGQEKDFNQLLSQANTDFEKLHNSYQTSIQAVEQKLSEAEIRLIEIERLKQQAQSEFLDAVKNVLVDSEQKHKELERLYSEARDLISKNNKNIDELRSDFSSKVAEYTGKANEKNDSLTKEQDKISQKTEELAKIHEECLKTSREITKLKEESATAKAGVQSDVAAIANKNTEFSELLSQSQTLQVEVSKKHDELQTLLKDSKNNYDRISTFHVNLVVGQKDANGKVILKPLSEEINDLHKSQKEKYSEMTELVSTSKDEVSKFISTSEAEYNKLKASLKREIRDLLPGAGAAGLSSAYVQAKSRYGHISYDKEPIKVAPWKWLNSLIQQCDKFIHILLGNFSTILYYIMFLVPLIFMFYHFSVLFHELNDSDLETLAFLKVLGFKFILSLPLGLVSMFGFYSIRLNRRLFEEYNHKQRVMQLYHSFKQEIEQHGSDEHKKALIGMMITAVQDKPSLAMHKYDQGLEEFFRSFLSNFNVPSKN